jgi:predicted O-methyltransferase YrrM
MRGVKLNTLLHFLGFMLNLQPPDSQVMDDELDLLTRYSSGKELIVEIGCYEGRTSAALASSTRGTVFSIDPFLRGRLGIPYGEVIAKVHRKRRSAGNLKFIKGYSYDVVRSFGRKIDLLFIDADHSFEGAKRDWIDWLPKVKLDGIIGAHDCKISARSPSYLGSMRIYEELLSTSKSLLELESIGSLVVFRKISEDPLL